VFGHTVFNKAPVLKLQHLGGHLPGSVLCVIKTPSDLPYLLLLDTRIVYSVEGSKPSIVIPVRGYGSVCITVKFPEVSDFFSMV